MLWTDGIFVSTSDLAILDPEVADIAEVESITIDGTNGLCAETISECLSEVMAKMQSFGGYLSCSDVSANHLAALYNVGGPGVNRVRVLPSQIVIRQKGIPQVDALRRWVVYRCLYNVFRAASNRTREERLAAKRDSYWNEARRRYLPLTRENGLPIVRRPFPCPGALMERNAGNWDNSNVSLVTKMGTAGGMFDVAITRVDNSLYRGPQYGGRFNPKSNAESYTSQRITVQPTAGQAISVSLSGLNCPDGTEDPANVSMALISPLIATGFNVYAGTASGTLYLQNATPVPVSTGSYTLSADPILSGYASDWGQYQDATFVFNQDMLQRG